MIGSPKNSKRPMATTGKHRNKLNERKCKGEKADTARRHSDKTHGQKYRGKLSTGYRSVRDAIISALQDNPDLISELNIPQTFLAGNVQVELLDDPSHEARTLKGTRPEMLEYAAKIIRQVPSGIACQTGDWLTE
jgi:hypothetical protein